MPPAGARSSTVHRQANKRRQEQAEAKKVRDQKIATIVKQYDVSHTGGLNKAELKALLTDIHNEPPTDEEIEWVLKESEKDADEMVTAGELEHALQLYADHRHLKPEIEVYFQKYDKEGNGELSREEVKTLLTDLGGKEPSDKDMDWVLERSDVLKNGVITKPELMLAITMWYARVNEEEESGSSCCTIL
mmetsp:Transcript_80703/g.142169  ORF Transcript_80703/g.142169 Transcript_80703/m.142169 type:complete len:190 (-) Transcript_80703:176-745(-)